MEMMDPCLINSTQERNDSTISLKLNMDTGLYSIYNIQPSTVNEDGSQKKCSCGKVYHKDGIFKANGTLYTRLGPVNIQYYDSVCESRLCVIPFTQAAEEKGIFLFTHLTAAGDEIGWGFINSVQNMKCSFTAFCNEMTHKYQTTNVLAAPFMTTNTFISWFFA